jgi:Ca2+-binding RTX toxin-like protein
MRRNLFHTTPILLAIVLCLTPVRSAWAVDYCPGAFNSADCVVDTSVYVCDATTYAHQIVCDMSAADGSSSLNAVSNYNSGDFSFWGSYDGETFCCHYPGAGYTYDHIKIDGSEYADTIKLTYTNGSTWELDSIGVSLGVSVDLHGGNDIYLGSDSTDTTGYDETCLGDDGDDTMGGRAGSDTLFGGADADTITGGTGLDTIYGDAGDDSIVGGQGPDVIRGGDGLDSISGGEDGDYIYGEAGADIMCGDAGDDYLYADDSVAEGFLYDKIWDTDGNEATCGHPSTRTGGGSLTETDSCSLTHLSFAPSCP